ncbi:30S ribosomal protein S1 [Campylobacter sp. MIT 97-5078]|uniref:30S ribosomal protein S1 n=1 Tax=Campylobacter sp. MIT 97-5078 TaxID=1548153 RepID=UPI00051315D0|nr:30S ribosomal protein S1 [Campylobacter sp. MIT 97-5078]KGI56988.1 30S ribosomal protein S1 [Campylobacter sp. MIT 97-5078]TQR28180.1 30S ribosomal protein S1 [Campylobacter sp. MIT 97-5078]
MAEANKKVQTSMDDFTDEENFEQLLKEFDKKDEGAITQGVIVAIKDEEAFVDIGKKSEGILAIDELKDAGGNLLYKEGDKLEVAVIGNRNGKPLVSHKKALRKQKVVEFIKNYTEDDNKILNVKIISKNKGGFVCVDDDGVEFFLPRSQYLAKDSNVIGKSLKVKIIKIDQDEQSIVVSRKKILDDERKKRKELVSDIVEEDKIIKGVIKKITSYGMFVDVGGVDGLVHYSEISYKGHVNPNALYKEGDSVSVKAIKYDKDKKHLSLSIKAAQPDPWKEIKDSLELGDTIKVIVSNIENYGAFVDLGNDIEGFLHISELSWDKNIKHPRDYISKGQELEVEVIEIDPNQKRLRVSLKNLLAKPFDEFVKKYKVGDIIRGKVSSLTNFGAFIVIDGIEALLHNEDCSWDRNDKCKDLYKIGDELEVKIIKIDPENQKVSLSIRELSQSPVQTYIKEFGIGKIVKGKIKDIKDFGIFVELRDGVDALIHKEDISVKDMEELKVGDEIESVISFVDEKKNRIRLSVKNLKRMKEREVLNETNNNDRVSLGDIIKEQLS